MPTLEQLYDRTRAENDAAHQKLTRLGVDILDCSKGGLRSYTLAERIGLLVAKVRKESTSDSKA